MNKRAMTKMWWIILGGILALVVFFAMTGIFGWSLKRSWDFWKETFSFSSSQLEDLKKATQKQIIVDAEGDYKRHKEVSEMKGILIVASNFMTGNNEKTTFEGSLENGSMAKFSIGGGNEEKIRNYTKAIEQYLEYSKRCKYGSGGPTVASCLLPKKGIQFRILNALREKFYVLIAIDKNEDKASEEYGKFKPVNYANLISENEFKSSIVLIFMSAYTTKAKEVKDYDKVDVVRMLYKGIEQALSELYLDEDTLDREYAAVVSYYFSIKKDKAGIDKITELLKEAKCARALAGIEKVKHKINDGLGSQKKLNALDYKFVSEPYKELTELCKTS